MYPQGLPPDSVLLGMQRPLQQSFPLLHLKEVIRDRREQGILGEGDAPGSRASGWQGWVLS